MQEPTVSLTVPLFIRLLEWSREEARSDAELHTLTEALSTLNVTKSYATMDHYDTLLERVNGKV